MRVTQRSGYISMRDRVVPFWILGLFLLGGGVLVVAMALGLATNAGDLEPWQRLASLGVGLGVTAGALWWLGRSPATHVRLDLARRELRLVRVWLWGWRVRSLSLNELASVEVEQGLDDEGSPVWRPALRLKDGERVTLSELWSHDERGAEAGATVVAEACRLPLTKQAGASAEGTA